MEGTLLASFPVLPASAFIPQQAVAKAGVGRTGNKASYVETYMHVLASDLDLSVFRVEAGSIATIERA